MFRFSINHLLSKKTFCICTTVALLSGCAAGKMFMAGYTPPNKIGDLINEQERLSGQLPEGAIGLNIENQGLNAQEIKNRSNQKIGLNGYPEQTVNTNASNTLAQDPFIQQTPPQKFRPRYTYKSVQDYAAQLAMNLVKNANHLDRNAAIGVTSFVKLDSSLQNTTVLGNQMAEYSISEIQQFGINVVDFKLMPAIEVRRNGDLAFSRDVLQLANNKIMDHVMSATMIERADGIFINARIIAIGSNRVVSSASVLVPRFVAQQISPQSFNYGL